MASAFAAFSRASVEHLVGHVQPVRLAGRVRPLGGEQHVDPAAGTEVEDGLALAQLGDRGRVAASEAREHRLVRELPSLVEVVELDTPKPSAGSQHPATSLQSLAALPSCTDRRRPRSGPAPCSRSSIIVSSSFRLHREGQVAPRRRLASPGASSRPTRHAARDPDKPASTSFLMWKLTVGCESPNGSVRLHTHTGSAEDARRLRTRTRAGSARALNTAAVAWASILRHPGPCDGHTGGCR